MAAVCWSWCFKQIQCLERGVELRISVWQCHFLMQPGATNIRHLQMLHMVGFKIHLQKAHILLLLTCFIDIIPLDVWPVQEEQGRTHPAATVTCCSASTLSIPETSAASPSTSSTTWFWIQARPCSWEPTNLTLTFMEVSRCFLFTLRKFSTLAFFHSEWEWGQLVPEVFLHWSSVCQTNQ